MENKDLDKQLTEETTQTSQVASIEETSAIEKQTETVNEAETATSEETSAHDESQATNQTQEESDEERTSLLNFSIPEFDELVSKAKEIAASNDWQNGGFYIKELKTKWSELTVPEGLGDAYKALEQSFKEAEDAFFSRKRSFYEDLDKKRKDNLEIKKGLLEKVERLIERKKWSAQNELRSIQNRWEQLRTMPHEVAEELNKKFEELVDTFDKGRVEFLVKKKEQEENNLEGKLYVLDRLKKLLSTVSDQVEKDWSHLDHEMEEIYSAWKKIGKITAEKADEVWGEFKQLKDEYYVKKAALNPSYKKEIDNNERKKRAIIEKAKKLLEFEDISEAAREINRLHKEWKDIGHVAPNKAEELWEEFKKASEEFNAYKFEHTDEIREQEKRNYELKEALCDEAEKWAETDEWRKGQEKFNELLNEWRKIGPVPRNKTKTVWLRFKKAQDNFYARKRQNQKEVRSEERENLQKKRDIIELIKALAYAEDMQAAATKVKELQKEFNGIGYVPIKTKEKVIKSYKEACDTFYNQLRKRRSEDSSYHGTSDSNFKNEAQSVGAQLIKLKRQAEKLNETILRYKDAKTYFKPNDKGLQLREEIDLKIASYQKELDAVNKEIELIKKDQDAVQSES